MLNARTSLRWQLWGAFTVIVALAVGAGVWLADELRDGERQPVAAATADSARIAPRGGAQTVTVQESFTLTLRQPPNGALTASPEATTYKKDASVTVTATPRAGYRLKAWGGDCAGTPASSPTCTLTMNANKTVSATFSPKPRSGPLTLIVVSDGSHDSLLLEWTGGPSDATKWQYRQRTWRNDEPQAWSPWTDIPNSDAHTRSYRLTSLSSGQPYDYELRAVRGTVAGAPSRLAEGTTQYPSPRIPIIDAGQIVEGDGRTPWRIHGLPWVITIPDGMRLRGGEATISSSGDSGVALRDVSSGSVIGISALTGKETERFIATSATDDAAQSAPARDVNALFDQIIASVREVPVQ